MNLTPQKESFCLNVVHGMSYVDAHIAAYPNKSTKKTHGESASRLLKRADIIARIEELRQPAVEAASMSLESHLNDLLKLKKKALKKNQLGNAIQCEIARGKHSGVAIDRKELTGPNGTPIEAVLNVTLSK